MPVDRETGRPRGFAFVEFAERSVAEQVIDKFNAQPFMGRNLAVSEARAREDRPPGPRPPGGGFGGPRPAAAASAVRVRRRRLRRSASGRRWLWRRRWWLWRRGGGVQVAPAAAIAPRTSVRPRHPSVCAAARRPLSRNTSREVRSRSAPAAASTLWTTSKTARQSISTISRPTPRKTRTPPTPTHDGCRRRVERRRRGH